MKSLRVGQYDETVIERSDYPANKVREILAGDIVAVLGYGSQGRGQSINLRDSGLSVIVGLRETSPSWKQAQDDGWIPGRSLFSLSEAAMRGSIIAYLLSDAGQKDFWPQLKPHLTSGKALCFSHGFSIVYQSLTGIVSPAGVDVFMVAPKGSGTTLRRSFTSGQGMNSGYAIHHDATGRALERCMAFGFAIGSANLIPTTFEREVVCDLVGERGTLLGAIYGLWLAQYEVLREHGHPPTEAFFETVEEATQSLYPLIAEKGMDWMYANCSTTAQRGALDWYRQFRDAAKPVFEALYESVRAGDEAARALEANSRANYREQLAAELRDIAESEMWQAGREVRQIRPSEEPRTK